MYHGQGRISEAIEAYKRCQEPGINDSYKASAYYGEGLVQRDEEKWVEAGKCFTKAVDLFLGLGKVYYLPLRELAKAQVNLDQRDAARKSLIQLEALLENTEDTKFLQEVREELSKLQAREWRQTSCTVN